MQGSNTDRFWQIVDSTLDAGDQETKLCALENALSTLSRSELEDFAASYCQAQVDAYRWDLWGAAYVINGGASDDGFHYFCSWLISCGRKVYDAALAEPESLADFVRAMPVDEEVQFEFFEYVARGVYERRFPGEEMPPPPIKWPQEPQGQSWEEDEVYELYPKLTEVSLERY